jgi:hypothetical protein
MASVATVRTAMEAALVAQLSVAAIVARPLSRDEAIPVGVTRASVVAVVGGFAPDSNTNFVLGNYVITIAHRLTDATDEDTYLDGDMLTDQTILMANSFFRGLSGVKDVEVGPDVDEVSRTGNVLEYTVTVQLLIVP